MAKTHHKDSHIQEETKKKRFQNEAPIEKLVLLMIIVPHGAADTFEDFLKENNVAMQLFLSGQGTAPQDLRGLLGLDDLRKDIIIAPIKQSQAAMILQYIEMRFQLVPKKKGIAFTVSMTSMIGVALYKFLTNSTHLIGGKTHG